MSGMVRLACTALVAGCVCFVLTGHPVPCPAQPFSTIDVRAGASQTLRHGFVHEFWDEQPGGEFAFTTPFYFGALEAGGALHRFTARSEDVPPFNAILLFTGWNLGVELASRFQAETGLRIGNYRMTFDDDTFSGLRNENELTLAAHGGVSVRPVGPVAFYASVTYQKTYTFNRIKLWYGTAGIRVRFTSPGWLRTFLR